MTAFSDYVQKQAIAQSELPLVHTTEYFRLASIQASHSLEPGLCRVFNEHLLYFFYGRPAYRDCSLTTPSRDVGFCPICFLFKPGTIINKAKRLYPFDTGASQHGLYEPAIARTSALAAFQVLPTTDSAKGIVSGFFETAEHYLSNKPNSALVFSSTENDARAYHQLIMGGGNPQCDDRCSAVEVQVEATFSLRDVIKAVVLPTCFLEDGALANTIMNIWGAQPVTYDFDSGIRPLELHGTIRHLVRQYYRQSKLI